MGILDPMPTPAAAAQIKRYGAKADAKTFSDGAMTSSSAAFSSASAGFTSADIGKTIGVAGAGASVTATTTGSTMSTSTVVTAITCTALPAGIGAGTVTLTSGGNTQVFTVPACPAGSTSIPVKPVLPTFAFASGSTITASAPLVTTISGVTNSTTATLAAAAGTTVSGATYAFGTDDTTAVQAAINTGLPVDLGSGSAMVRTLAVPSGCTIYAANGGGILSTPSRSGRLILKPGTNGPILQGVVGAGFVTLRNIKLEGTATLQTARANAIEQQDTSAFEAHWTIDNVTVQNAAGSGIYVGVGNRATQVVNSYVYGSGNHGIQLEQSDCVVLSSKSGTNFFGGGIYIHSAAWNAQIALNNIWSNRVGIQVQSVNDCYIIGNFIDTNFAEGIYMDGGQGFVIVGNQFSPNSQAADTYAANISLGDLNADAFVGGNSFFMIGAAPARLPNYDVHLGTSFASWIDGGNARNGGETRFGYSGGTQPGITPVEGTLRHRGAAAGFFGATPAAKPTVTGSKASGAALTSLLTALSGLGLITDSTSA